MPAERLQNRRRLTTGFFENPFSDLGRTHVFDGRSNTISMVLFVIAMVCGAMGLAAFFYRVLRRHPRHDGQGDELWRVVFGRWERHFVLWGVACTPWDFYVHLHMHFVFGAYFLAAVDRHGPGSRCGAGLPGRYRRRLVMAFAVFILLLIAYIILLTAGLSGGPGEQCGSADPRVRN